MSFVMAILYYSFRGLINISKKLLHRLNALCNKVVTGWLLVYYSFCREKVMADKTRERWLKQMAGHLKREFERQFYEVPGNIRISCGLPSSRAFGANRKTIGQCWNMEYSKDSHFEIFISPVIDDSITVAATLAHEMCHAVVGMEHGHRKPFLECARSIGLEGRATATYAGERIKRVIESAVKRIGEYPHARIDYSRRKKEGTRMLKVGCPNTECGHFEDTGKIYSLRMSFRAIGYGLPSCGCCGAQMEECR
jgi:hypothetical protein